MGGTLDQINQLVAGVDDATRPLLLTALNRLVLSLETPSDTIHRYGHMVGLTNHSHRSAGALLCLG